MQCIAKTQYWKYEKNISRKELRGLSPSFHIHVSVSDYTYIPTIGLPILLQENMWTDDCGNWDWGRRNSFPGNT